MLKKNNQITYTVINNMGYYIYYKYIQMFKL